MFKVTWARLCVWDVHACFGRTHGRVHVLDVWMAEWTFRICARPSGRACCANDCVDVFGRGRGSANPDPRLGRARGYWRTARMGVQFLTYGSAVRDARLGRAHGSANGRTARRFVTNNSVGRAAQLFVVHDLVGTRVHGLVVHGLNFMDDLIMWLTYTNGRMQLKVKACN